MEPLAAMSLAKGGAIQVAKALWENQYRESPRADVRENARNHLLSIEVARDLWSLEFLIEKYRAKTKSFPGSLQELARGKQSSYRIADPLETPYRYDPNTGEVSLSPESKVKYLHVPQSYRESLTIDD